MAGCAVAMRGATATIRVSSSSRERAVTGPPKRGVDLHRTTVRMTRGLRTRRLAGGCRRTHIWRARTPVPGRTRMVARTAIRARRRWRGRGRAARCSPRTPWRIWPPSITRSRPASGTGASPGTNGSRVISTLASAVRHPVGVASAPTPSGAAVTPVALGYELMTRVACPR